MNSLQEKFTRLGAHFAKGLMRLPAPVVKLLAGPVPRAAKGLHPDALLIGRLAMIPRPGLKPSLAGVGSARARMDIEAEIFGAIDVPNMITADRVVPGPAGDIPARLYVPEGVDDGRLMVYFHGGGWVVGSLDSHHGVCKLLAHRSGVRILSIDYRLAPEHPFPAASDDALAAYEYVVNNPDEFGADASRIAVGGDSAGGNLAAVTAIAARDKGLPAPAFQLLIYPVVDMSMSQESYRLFDRGYYLTNEVVRFYRETYAPDPASRKNPLAAPLHTPDLGGLPSTYLATALADPLRDEGRSFVDRLRAADVAVTHQEFPLLHGFINMLDSRASRHAAEIVAEELSRGLPA